MKKIAYIGAGPSALLGAQALLNKGDYQISIYDKNNRSGGAAYTGIPSWRFSLAFIDRVEKELKEKGTQFYYNVEVGKDIPFAKLREENDVVVVAIGAQIENLAGFEAGNGYEAGLTLLYNLNILHQEKDYQEKYQSAIVWGGGNVAMDCCRSLKRILPDVQLLYRRSQDEMPASKGEVKDAVKEGVVFHYLENIADIVRDVKGSVTGVQADTMVLGEKDESGRASVHVQEGSKHFIPADLVVAAVGQKVDFSVLDEGLKTLSKSEHKTNLEGVFVCGDALYGPAMIGNAIKDGKACSEEVFEYLSQGH
ncbi:FAD-dependent oxidoreductase [Bulleidia sp. zg-1006]|uniref:FAD-dependent oxidoreductase n=1 Tax=Bulleidia sp. zg-1006 TaxID=2806552 RepID=UPI0019399B5A|nr:FAD-dependent oxidoreductase [Bulleidia sp. zg-1006]QRG87023.1 FAD-dependent oxidoreductase [Bulleidia sp. zg-1006]